MAAVYLEDIIEKVFYKGDVIETNTLMHGRISISLAYEEYDIVDIIRKLKSKKVEVEGLYYDKKYLRMVVDWS